MEKFAGYGFNKSHSAAYALLSIQTAWLKAHHPAEFMAATMTSEMRKSERIIQLIDECKMLGLTIMPPSINQPRAEFGVTPRDEILFGMGAVKGVGTSAIEAVLAARETLDRPFGDLFDLCEHVDLQKVNRKVLESLIHAGALDCLPGDRATLIANLDRALAYGQKAARDREGGQASLFGGGEGAVALKPVLQEAEPYDPLVELSLERQALGFFLSGHPFHEYRELMASLEVSTTQHAASRGEGAWVDLAGVVTSFRNARDKHKRLYARAHFEDRAGMLEMVVYARLYAEVADLVASDAILVVGGRIQVRGDGSRELVADRITRVDEVLGRWTREVLLEVDLAAMGATGLQRLEALFDRFAREQALPAPVQAEPALEAAAAPAEPRPEGMLGAVVALDENTAVPVPVMIDARRDGRPWLLQCGRKLALTLDSLRELRQIPGLCRVRLDVKLPAAPQRGGRGGRNGAGSWN
jgi:DNA polymerase-3 subunit alpha